MRSRFRNALGIVLFWAVAVFAESLRLKDGSRLEGKRVRVEDSTLIFRTLDLGELRVPLSAVEDEAASASAEVSADESARKKGEWSDPSGQALFFLPTAFTPPKGSLVFRDFELLFLTFGFSPTSTTSISGGAMFPITDEFNAFTFGVKQGLWAAPDGRMAMAITGNITKPVGADFDDESALLLNSNLMFSARLPNRMHKDALGFHVGLGYAGVLVENEHYDFNTGETSTHTDWYDNLSVGGGFEARLTPNAKFILEYLSAFPLEDGTDENLGVLTFGFRLHGSRLSADIAGFRPIGEDFGDLILLPLLVVSYRI
jgi:hypothetical protein